MNRALKQGSQIVDNSLLATFKVRASKKKTNLKDIKFTVDSKKFRPFKRRKGVKIPLQQGFIERRKFRLDTPGEKRQIKTVRKAKEFLGLTKRKRKKR